LPDDSIIAADIAAGAVTTAKVADANITAAKLDGAQTGSAPIYGCRAWVNFDATRNEADTGASTNGANVKIRASGNVTSVLKNSTGNYTVNFTTAMPDANFAYTCSVGDGNHSSAARALSFISSTASSLQVLAEVTSTGGNTDEDQINIAIFR